MNRSIHKHLPLYIVVWLTALLALLTTPLNASAAQSPYVQVVHGHIIYHNAPFSFLGYNAYELATTPGVTSACGVGPTQQQLDSFFKSLPQNATVRFDAFEAGFATNIKTGALDFQAIDNIVATATADHILLIPVLANQWGTCDDGRFKDAAWFASGYKAAPIATYAQQHNLPTPPLSYLDYVKTITSRYKTATAIAAWEPIGEATPLQCTNLSSPDCNKAYTCKDNKKAAALLTTFYTAVGRAIRANDPNHVIEAGLLGGAQCGTANGEYTNVIKSSGIDIASVHLYYNTSVHNAYDHTVLRSALAAAAAVKKPLIDGEMGFQAGGNCPTLLTRASSLTTERNEELAAGAEGFLVWNYVPEASETTCTYEIAPTDPLFSAQ